MSNRAAQAVSSVECNEERDRVLMQQLPQVRYIARRIHERLPRHVPFEDLVHAGVVGLIDALNKFDGSKHVQFRSYAKFRIRGAILDSLRELDWSPRELRRKGRSVEEAYRHLCGTLGRAPGENELARELGLELRELQSLLAELDRLELGSLRCHSFRDGKEQDLCEYIPGTPEDTPFSACLRSEMKHLLADAIAELPEKERKILSRYYYEQLTMKEVGVMLGIGESRVSQIHSHAMSRLRDRLGELLTPADSAIRSKSARGRAGKVLGPHPGIALAPLTSRSAANSSQLASVGHSIYLPNVSRRDGQRELPNMNNTTPPHSSIGIADALIVSSDRATINQLSESMQQFAIFPEVCVEVPTALVLLNRRKFDAVIVDLQPCRQATALVEQVRRSPSNRTAVIFSLSDSDTETASAFRAGSNFVLTRPLSLASIDRSLKVAYGLILRERRRYFRCPVKVPVAICRADMTEVHGQTLNISESGMAITSSVPLRPGARVQVHFALPGHEGRFTVDAAIRWCKESCFGLQFTSISPQLTSELQDWLLRRLEENLPESLADKFRNLGNASTDRPCH